MTSSRATAATARRAPQATLAGRLSAERLVTIGAVLLGGCGAMAPSTDGPRDQRSLAEYDLARDAFQRGQLREALGKVDEAVKLDDENADAAYLGAVIHLAFCAKDERSSDCRFDAAERYARQAIAARPALSDARNLLGVVLVHQRRYDEAVGVLRPLAEDILYPSPEKAWGNLGWAYLEQGSTDEAIDALRRAVAAQPHFCVGHYRLALAYEKKGELALSHDGFTRALETDRPECRALQEAYDGRARVGLKQGLRDEARADLERCMDIAAGTPTGKRCAEQLRTLP